MMRVKYLRRSCPYSSCGIRPPSVAGHQNRADRLPPLESVDRMISPTVFLLCSDSAAWVARTTSTVLSGDYLNRGGYSMLPVTVCCSVQLSPPFLPRTPFVSASLMGGPPLLTSMTSTPSSESLTGQRRLVRTWLRVGYRPQLVSAPLISGVGLLGTLSPSRS